MFNFFAKKDTQLQKDVKNELNWDPSVTSCHVSVVASDGIVTLRGSVPHYFEKAAAEQAAQRVGGVRAVADELEVELMGPYERSDEDIARAALMALDWNYQVPEDVKVTVEKGWITLRGEAEWAFQKSAAKTVVSQLMGVRGVTNEINIKAKVQPSDVKNRIEEALKRTAEHEGHKINVEVDGDRVTLSGDVHSLFEIGDAGLAAWNAPGVTAVENNLKLAH